MYKEDIKKLCEERGIIYKADFMDGLSEKQFDEGCIKLYIPADGNGGCGEGIWGWITPEDKKKYMDDNFYGEIKSVLCNNPINYFGILFWGCEIPIICQGKDRPILSEDYIKNVLLPIVNKQK